VNVNIGPFPKVDVVADAHLLPYADGSVDAIFCEAVLEHLAEPGQSVREMHRVLRRGGKDCHYSFPAAIPRISAPLPELYSDRPYPSFFVSRFHNRRKWGVRGPGFRNAQFRARFHNRVCPIASELASAEVMGTSGIDSASARQARQRQGECSRFGFNHISCRQEGLKQKDLGFGGP
jgi:ubiquinone/menaquinone biosynthesis C-methylase UbiE